MDSIRPEMASSSSSVEDPRETNHDDEQRPPRLRQQRRPVKDCMYKTKTVQFLGRTALIVLQNDNGSCPLISICNVLLLRNRLNLNPDIAEVSQEKLLALVTDALIESNNNMNTNDAGSVQNNKKVSDALDLLPRLATGINVDLKFRRIDDFEYTPELEIFDLLDIRLYHGWLIDPQDHDTANAIGSKSFDVLSEELVALDVQNNEGQYKYTEVDDCVNFMAATIANLGVPSPNLSKIGSFGDSPDFISDNQIQGKEGLEDLFGALKLFEPDSPSVSDPLVSHIDTKIISASVEENTCNEEVIVVGNCGLHELESSLPNSCTGPGNNSNEQTSSASTLGEEAKLSLKADTVNDLDHSTCIRPEESEGQNDVVEKNSLSLDTLVQNESLALLSPVKDFVSLHGSHAHNLVGDKVAEDHEDAEDPHEYDATRLSCLSAIHINSDLSSGEIQQTNASERLASSVDGSEPIYEGDDCVLGTRTEENTLADTDIRAKNKITPQGKLISSFLQNNASQLTDYGLFCLRDGLKHHELCVLFRNNHFSTMFKFDGELYLLATDEGYIETALVWEKLSEIKGDTSFMTGDFKKFGVKSNEDNTWDEDDALRNTADYLAHIDSTGPTDLNMNSDLQLAIALQRQELERQPSQHDLEPFFQ